jgi:RNA polymerase subunit RPABC4/transcription elongation factor Spt4
MSGRFCQKCGVLLEEGDVFCYSCGAEQHADISEGSETASEIESETTPPASDAPETAEPVSSPESRKFCAYCGAVLHSGDRFCEKCGKDQSSLPKGARGGRERKKSVRWGPIFQALFWCLVGFGFYTAYKTFWSDIPWKEVIAVVTGRKPGLPDKNSSGAAIERTGVLPPIAPGETTHQNVQSSGNADVGGFVAPPVTEGRVSWTERDNTGHSRPVIIGEGGARPASLPGSVTGSRIRLRAGPNSGSEILGSLGKGTVVEVVGRYSSGKGKFYWYNVNSGDLSGWMYGEYLSVEKK